MRRFFYILLLLTFNLGFLTSQESGYSVEFSQVLINGKKIDFNEKTVILSEQDSITISYLCKNNKNEQTPFLFRTELLSGEQSAVKSISEPIIQYKKTSRR